MLSMSSYSECTCHLRQGAIALCRFAIGDFWGALTDALVCFFGFLCIFAWSSDFLTWRIEAYLSRESILWLFDVLAIC